jgi:selenoprotein W-related protein
LVLKQRIGALRLIPSTGGVFEVTLDGEKVYSKRETGQFPEPAAILQDIRGRL